MLSFNERLDAIQQRKKTLLCVGLDTDPSLLPKHLHASAQGVLEFNRRIIEATEEFACAFKINLAFYEAQGVEGWKALEQTRSMIPPHTLAIADGKRGDIGNTSLRYAESLYKDLNFDSATVNPYMGSDSVAPFLGFEDRCTFILALTSNPGSADLQRLKVGDHPLYKEVVRLCVKWNTKNNVGLVVGATRSEELKEIRTMAGDMPILIPGIGAQGGDLHSAIANGRSANSARALINASRSIVYASKEKDFDTAARAEAERLRNEMARQFL